VDGEVWLSNDVSELVRQDEVVSVRLVEILFAASGSEGIRSVFSHLLEDINLLMPSSRYRISVENGALSISWSDIDFEFHENATKEGFLNLLVEQYDKTYFTDSEVCLALSGGYDSRLELAILTNLNKKVHCYHYITSKHEAKQARLVAQIAGASFHEFPSEQMMLPGWNVLKELGYLTRWDGFFAAGTLYSAGLYTKIIEEYPTSCKLIMGFGELRGRLYEQSNNMLDYWIKNEEITFIKCVQLFPEKYSLICSEIDERKDFLRSVVHSIQCKCPRGDIAMDIAFGMLSRQGKLATRSTFLFENGMPFFSINREVRDYFMSLPQLDKKEDTLLKWAIGQLNPDIMRTSHITSSMSFAERQFGLIGRVPLLGALLDKFTTINKGYSQDWFHDADVSEIFEQIPEIKYISERAAGDKPRLYLAQICRFLKALEEKKNVSFCIVE